MKMPDMNGTENPQTIACRGVTAPILMLTMSRDEQDLQAALRNGAKVTCSKTWIPEDLVPAAAGCVAWQQRRRQRS